MNEPLQQFDWKHSSYERPGDRWVCGRACEGADCSLGPTAKGDCGDESVCAPEKVGDRFICTRPGVHGGKCVEGPSPEGECCQVDTRCLPKRSLRGKRKMAGLMIASAALAVCLYAVGPSVSQPVLSPGQVTSAHAGIEANCAACHVAADGSDFSTEFVATHGEFADSQKCLECHSNLGAEPMLAHSLDKHLLARISAATDEQRNGNWSLRWASLLRSGDREARLSCATCHREHHGRQFDLKKISDSQCQSCHKAQFEDFAHGHPEFTDYPHQRRTRIYFDHARHLKVYFKKSEYGRLMPGGAAVSDCMSCHEEDAAGGAILTKGYDQSCRSCHEEQIVDLAFPGIPVFALSKRTLKSTVEAKIPVGMWPQSESSHNDVPPLMQFLLDQFQQGDVKEGTQPQTVWQVKRLLLKVVRTGETAFETLLTDEHSGLQASLRTMVPTLIQATESWFPELEQELKGYDAGDEVESSAPTTLPERPPTNVRGWYFSAFDQSVRYRPVGHGDPIMQGLLEHLEAIRSTDDHMEELKNVLANPSGSIGIGRSGPLANGRCLMCHTTDRDVFGNSVINWRTDEQHGSGSFTEFRHQPHTRGGDPATCLSCHELDDPDGDATYRSEFFARDGDGQWRVQSDANCPATSGIRPLEKQRCASCHNEARTSQNCLQCHNYHVHNK